MREGGYINVHRADNIPYFLTLNNSARTYVEQLAEYAAQKATYRPNKKKVEPIIFISHRSSDKAIADMLVDFFSGTGIPRETVFCSSLPGNDINEKISGEVKTALKNSVVNIAILSANYYQSAYCLNEAGILWYQDDVPVIPIALPEINSGNMYGFLSNEYKLRRLDSDTDVSYIYDIVSDAVSSPHTKVGIITQESNKLRARYSDFLATRKFSQINSTPFSSTSLSEITTDDERIVLYYILQKNVRKVSKEIVLNWLHTNEIYGVNIDNAFDLLSSIGGGSVVNGTLEFGLDAFRKYSSTSSELLIELEERVNQHKKLAVNTFNALWKCDVLDSTTKLLFAYIFDERMCSFGSRWMADAQVKSIKQWESKNWLDSTLSDNYGSALQFLIQNDFVYESDWTSYGKPRAYTLCPSLQALLFNCPEELYQELQKIQGEHQAALPF